jgi:hypothetical protein
VRTFVNPADINSSELDVDIIVSEEFVFKNQLEQQSLLT